MTDPGWPRGANDIAADIAGRIVRQEWRSGEKLPTTKWFADYYGVNDRTITSAFQILVMRNIVRGVAGGGRYVV